MPKDEAKRRPLASVSAAVVLLGLLVLLGTLQYRWVGEVSTSERAQLRAGLRARAESFGREFDREITRAFVWLQLDAETLRGRNWRRYAERYQAWSARAVFPKLVKDVFLVERQKGAVSLLRFDSEKGVFSEEADWPSFLADVKTRLDTGASPAPFRQIGEEGVQVGGIPALLAPVLQTPPGDAPSRQPPREGAPSPSFVVIVLDGNEIRKDMLPTLEQRYFGGDSGEAEYAITVTNRGTPSSVVYRSDAKALSREEEGANLFTLRFEDLPSEDRAALSSLRRLSERRERGRRQLRGMVPGPDAGYWRLAAARRGESLDETVEAARRRNLAVGFGILVLLGGSVGLIVAGAVRARRLAERQMDFVAGVTHELRTPVAVVCAAGENLADGLVTDPIQVKRYGTTIRDEGRRLAEMVEQALDFAGIHSGRRRLSSEPLDISGLVQEVLGSVSRRLEERGFTLERHVAPDLPIVLGDASALKRALHNLLDNALKYSGDSRWIGFWAETRRVDGKAVVRIVVEDRGLGIAPGEKDRVFEPFFRGRDAQASQEHGFGLGLSLVTRIIAAHGGQISVESSHGKGSSFVITLPVAETPGEGADLLEGKVDGIPHSAR